MAQWLLIFPLDGSVHCFGKLPELWPFRMKYCVVGCIYEHVRQNLGNPTVI